MVSYKPPRGVIAYTWYESQHDSNDFFFFLLNLAPGIVSCLIHWIATLSSFCQVTYIQHSSSAERRVLWTYVLGREW